MSIKVSISLTERFLNWYPSNTTLYFRRDAAERKAEDGGALAVMNRHFDQLVPFFAQVQHEIDDAYARGHKDGWNEARAGDDL